MNNRTILKKIYSLISTIIDVKVNIFIEELCESQIELHLNNKKIKKGNMNCGVRIIIDDNNEIKYKSLSFFSYEDMFHQVIEYIEKNTNLKLIKEKSNTVFRKINDKSIVLNKQKKYNLISKTIKSFKGYDSLKVSLYEKKENIFIIKNTNKYILNIRNFYVKMMIKGKIRDNEVYDFILSDHGYKDISKPKIDNLIGKFKNISDIKTSKIQINNGNYDLILSNNCGTIFHEIFGHNLELNPAYKNKLSLFKKNNNLGNDLITFIDRTSSKNLLSIRYDEYANKTHNKILIDKGIVKQHIDTLRSENYKYMPAARMTNSYLKPNKSAVPLDLKKVKSGIYIYKISSGKLYLEKQKFKIVIDAGFLIKNGKVQGNISNLSFEVDVLNFIKSIQYVGKDLSFVPTVCGASSGNVFVYAGTPTVYIKNIPIIQL